MDCSIEGIAKSVVAGDKEKTISNVRKIAKTSTLDKVKAGDNALSFITSVLNAGSPTYEGKKVHILDATMSKEGVYTLKYKIGQSPKVLSTELGDNTPFMLNKSSTKVDSATVGRLSSDFEYVNNNDDFDMQALDITNNPERILEVAESLIEMDDYHNDESHNIVLRQQLRRITSSLVEMVPNLALHINSRSHANFGNFNPDTSTVQLYRGINGSKSLMEIYTHELYHAVTHFAISSADIDMRGTTARMEVIRDNFLRNTSELDLVTMSGGAISEVQAGLLLDHMTKPDVGLHEFVALSMTNKGVMNQLKTLNVSNRDTTNKNSLFYKMLAAVQKMFDLVISKITKEPKKDDLARMVFLVNKLHTANKKPLRQKKTGAFRNLISIISPLEERWVKYADRKMAEYRDNPSRNVAKDGEGNLPYTLKLIAKSFVDDEARSIISLVMSSFSIKGMWSPFSPEGSIATVLRDSFESDTHQDLVESMGMISQTIDQQREFMATAVASTVLEGFERQLTEEEEVSLTAAILDVDLSAIYFDYDVEAFLADKSKLDDKITELTKELGTKTDKQSLNYYKAQMDLLSRYMVNHEDNIALLKNSGNIAKKLDTPIEDMNVSPEIEGLIDKIISLKALRQTPKKDKAVLLSMMQNEPEGISNIVAHQQGQKSMAEEILFPTITDKFSIIKGYSAQISDPDIDITIAPVSKERVLRGQGYKLEKTLTKHELDKNDSPMGVYVSHRFVQQNFHRVGMRMTDKGRRGTTITESYAMSGGKQNTLRAANDIKNLRRRREAVIKLMSEGKYKNSDNGSDGLVSPVLSNSGRTKDFSYGMDKELKIDVLDMERKISTIMGRTAATTFDKKETETFNKRLMDIIEEDAEKNTTKGQVNPIGLNLKEYIKIEKDSSNPEVADLWRILPSDVKNRFKEGFIIRRDLMHSYLGFRELSITDLPGIRQMFGDNSSQAAEVIRYALQFAERLWKELVKISKIDIIIRTPGVFIGNVVSNFVLMYISGPGYSFKEITQLKLQGVKELKTHIDGVKETLALEARKAAGIITAAEERRLNVITNNLLNSPVKDLVDDGFYTTIIEEIEHSGSSDSYFGKVAKRKLKNVPTIFRDGFDMLYITERTQLFKLMEKGIQASDFAARYAQYHLMIKDGVSKEKASKAVRDNFINYNKPNGRFVEWANQMGFVMFTKYFTRIQRVLRDYGKNHPAKLLLSILGQDYVLGDIDSIDDQSIFSKDMGNLFYNPTDNLMRVITPTSAEAVNWAINKL